MCMCICILYAYVYVYICAYVYLCVCISSLQFLWLMVFHTEKSISEFILSRWKEILSRYSWDCLPISDSWESSGPTLPLGLEGRMACPAWGPRWSCSAHGAPRAAGSVCLNLACLELLPELEGLCPGP